MPRRKKLNNDTSKQKAIEETTAIEAEIVSTTSDAPIEVDHNKGTIKIAEVVTIYPMAIAEEILKIGWTFLSRRRH